MGRENGLDFRGEQTFVEKFKFNSSRSLTNTKTRFFLFLLIYSVFIFLFFEQLNTNYKFKNRLDRHNEQRIKLGWRKFKHRHANLCTHESLSLVFNEDGVNLNEPMM